MSSIARPRFWLYAAASLAALWITFRVLNADAAPRPPALQGMDSVDELPDPALDALIERLAVAAKQSRHTP
jgi:hypothetical protein